MRGDGDRVLINVTDTGMGISSDDLAHIFQKFYRADNSDTRTIGGTGLGLYLVKQRVEAMDGRVWAESAFGEGSTFYVSLPRISSDEYEKRMIAVRNQQIQDELKAAQNPPAAVNPAAPAPQPVVAPAPSPDTTPQPVVAPSPAPMPQAQPAPQPVVAPAPSPDTTPQPVVAATPAPNPVAPAPQPVVAPAAPPGPPSPPPTPPVPNQTAINTNNNLNGEKQ